MADVRIRAGDLRQRVTLQSPTWAADNAGATVPSSYTTIETVWAKVDPLSDTMIAQAAQSMGRVTHRVTIRKYTGLQSDWRLLYGTRYLYIVGPPRDIEERGVYVELRCEEGEVIA